LAGQRIDKRIRRRAWWGELVADVQLVVDANVGGTKLDGDVRPAVGGQRPAGRGDNTREEEDRSMSEHDYRKLTREDLDQLAGEALPERAAMSLVNANIAIPVNAAVAANVLSDGSIAYADATQQTPIDQGNLTGM
jgi:hypothetical protein